MELRKGYKQTEVGLIPEDWEVINIEQDIDLLTGFPFPSNKYSESGIKLLRGSNVKRGETDWNENITQYWASITPELKKYLLKEGDIVIAMDGSLVGKSFARLSKFDIPALLLQRVARIRTNKVDPGYLKEFICSEYFTKYCDKVKTSSAIPHISPKDIREFPIPLPPTKAEQTAIATALSDMDALISSQEQLIQKKKAIKLGAMQQLLKPKEGWVVKKLGEMCENISSGKSKTQSVEGKYPIYGSTGIIGWSNNFDYAGHKLLIARVGANAGAVNIVDDNYCVSDNTLMITLRTNFDLEFIFYWLINFRLNQLVFGSGQPLITGGQLKNIEITIPKTKDEQIQISYILSDIDNEIVSLEQNLSKYQQLKQGMMQELLTGKTRLV